MQTYIIHLRITRDGKSFLTQVRESAINWADAISKATAGWDTGDTVAVTGIYEV